MKLICHRDPGLNWFDKNELERAILEDERVSEWEVPGSIGVAVAAAMKPYRWLRKRLRPKASSTLPLAWLVGDKRESLAVLMGVSFQKVIPFALPGRKCVYLFDAWPQYHDEVISFLREWDVDVCFLSIRAVVDDLSRRLPECRFEWIPEAIDSSSYRFLPSDRKDIDVIMFGRKHWEYKALMEPGLRASGFRLVDDFLEPRDVFLDHLARSKISICFPHSMTNPAHCGGVETLTMRYLQSIASKCLIVGHAPRDMIDLFGYNPVVPADMSEPAKQLREILEGFADYEELVERNHETVLKHHQWSHRSKLMSDILFSNPLRRAE